MLNYPIYNRYNPPPQVGQFNDQPSMTQQHFAEECDINNILAKFVQTGILPNIGPGVYADLGTATDYRESLEIIMQAESMFADLPSHIRTRFENDPAQYLEFVHSESNRDEAISLGLINKNSPNTQQDPNLILGTAKTQEKGPAKGGETS